MNGVCNGIFSGPPPEAVERGQKVKHHLISITKSISKIFYTKLCVCSHKWKIQNISDGIFILSPGSCPRGGTFGRCDAQGSFFFQIWSCGISIQRGWRAEQNASKIFNLGWGKKVKYHSILTTMSILRFLYQFLCAFLQIKDRKHIEQNFHSVAGVMP